jgi:thioester reductase-like protein
VNGTIEIARLCLRKGIPLHYVSSAQVAMLGDTPPKSLSETSVRVANIVLSQENERYDGYPASKWVSEQLLENLGSGLHVWIHRPSIVTAPIEEDESITLAGSANAPLLTSVIYYSRLLRAVPSAKDGFINGTLDFIGMHTLVEDLVAAVLHGDDTTSDGHKKVSYIHHTGDEKVELDDLLDNLTQREICDIGKEAASKLPTFDTVPLAEWASRAQEAGMHALLATVIANAQEEMRPMFFPAFLKNNDR